MQFKSVRLSTLASAEIKNLPHLPGVYQMLAADNKVLYVGKAKNLRQRIASYFHVDLHPKTAALMSQVVNIEIIITANENAALLLECNLIKNLRPRYNILFKDDKSFPYLFLSAHKFARLSLHRGAKKEQGKYYGPFPHASALHTTLIMLQKIFRLRTCNDHTFTHRSRPCIQYQIKRCSAPCVGYIDAKTYGLNIKFIEEFLLGKNDQLQQEITKLMDSAADKLDYEMASYYRDVLMALRKVEEQQCMVQDKGNSDYVAVQCNASGCVVNVLFVRNGLVVGDYSCFPESVGKFNSDEVLANFLSQHYLQKDALDATLQKIVLSKTIEERSWLQAALREKLQSKIVILDHVKGAPRELLRMALNNANYALAKATGKQNDFALRFSSLCQELKIHQTIRRIECFDVSHTAGESTVASCVVFSEQGVNKQEYLRFNIKNATLGDDCAALREALTRRFQHTAKLPDVLLIDGGRGQLQVATRVLKELRINTVYVLAIAKGLGRKPGLEVIYKTDDLKPLHLDQTAPALHLLQQIRDEAHRFALHGHRRRFARQKKQSMLENIAGIGKSKRIALLKHFGGLAEIKGASVDDFCKVRGINKVLAEKIYEYLHH